MANGFVPVGTAALLYKLPSEDTTGLACYPSDTSFKSFEGAENLLDTLSQAFRDKHAVLIHGLPKTGKTFHALLFGHKWREQKQAAALYCRAGALDMQTLLTQWSHVRKNLRDYRNTLWIVDDVQRDLSVSKYLVDIFQSWGFGDAGLRLLFVGLASASQLRDLQAVPHSLSEHCIRLAIKACNLHVPSDEVLSRLVKTKIIGLLEIMWASQEDQGALEDPVFLPEKWLKQNWFKHLNDDEALLAIQLSRLRFLEVNHPAHPSLKRLVDVGLVKPLDPPLQGYQIVSDEHASAILRVYLRPFELVKSFYQPLADLINQRPRLAWPILSGLRDQKKAALEERIASSLEGDARLHVGFCEVEYKTVLKAIRWPDTSLPDVVCLLLIYAKHLEVAASRPTQSEQKPEGEIRDLAMAILRERTPGIRVGLEGDDLEMWRAANKLCSLASDASLERELRVALNRPNLLASLHQMQRSERSKVLLNEVRAIDAAAWERLEIAILADDLAHDCMAFFGGDLTRLSRADPTLTIHTVEALDKNKVGSAAIIDPRRCVNFLAGLKKHKANVRDQIMQLLRMALEKVSVNDETLAAWTHSRDFQQFVVLACELGRYDLLEVKPVLKGAEEVVANGIQAQVVDLCGAVSGRAGCEKLITTLARALEKRIEEGEMANAYLYALIRLDPARAAEPTKWVLGRLIKNRADLQNANTFWLMLNAVAVLEAGDRAVIRELAEIIGGGWLPGELTPPSQVALAGLVAFESGDDPPILKLDQNDNIEEIRSKASNPALTICQFYALAGTKTASDAREKRLRGLTAAIQNPNEEFRKDWKARPPRTRRYLLRMVDKALDCLKAEPSLAGMIDELARATAGPGSGRNLGF